MAVNGGNTAAAPPVTVNAVEEEEVNSACVQKGGVGHTQVQECSNPKGYDVRCPLTTWNLILKFR